MADSLAKLTQIFEQAKDLTIEAAVLALAKLSETPRAARPQEIAKLLNLRSDRDIETGMKCVISLISRGEDGVPYFADVVKNITTQNHQIRSLVLIYLVRFADVEPDIALLSVNSIQKSLGDQNPIHRARAMRLLAGIRLALILPIVVLAVKRAMSDPSPVVRASAAVAIGQVYDKTDSLRKQLTEFLVKLLADANVAVVGAAITTYCLLANSLAHRWDMVHGNFRRWCRILPELDEWSQTGLIELLMEYARRFLPKPTILLEDGQVIPLPPSYENLGNYTVDFDPDLWLLVSSLKELVYSSNQGVLLAAAKALVALAPPTTFVQFKYNAALVRMATTNSHAQFLFVALQLVARLCQIEPSLFAANYKQFYVYPTDPVAVTTCKLEILTGLAQNPAATKFVIEELKYYSLHSQPQVAAAALTALGGCCRSFPDWNASILGWSLRQIAATSGTRLNNLLNVVRLLLHQKMMAAGNNTQLQKEIVSTVYRLSQLLDNDMDASAKATTVWIIGEMTVYTENAVGPDVLRRQLKTFAEQDPMVRYQLLMMAAKVYLFELDKLLEQWLEDQLPDVVEQLRIHKMFNHVLHLAKYDSSYDTRDRARMLNVLLKGTKQLKLASLFLQVPKLVPLAAEPRDLFMLAVPEWADPKLLPPAEIRTETEVISNTLSSHLKLEPMLKRSRSLSPPLTGFGGGISAAEAIRRKTLLNQEIPVKTSSLETNGYRLQSLDEFFGSSEEEESEEESEDESEEAEEENDDTDEEDDEGEENETDEAIGEAIKSVNKTKESETSDSEDSDVSV